MAESGLSYPNLLLSPLKEKKFYIKFIFFSYKKLKTTERLL